MSSAPPDRVTGLFPSRTPALDNRRHLILQAIGDLNTRTVGHATLSSAGFQVLDCFTAGEIVPTLTSRRPDAVLVDDALEGGAITACNVIRGTAEGLGIPVLLLLSEGDRQTVDEAFAAGATDVVISPVSWPLVTHRMQRMLGTWQLLNRLREDRFSLEEAQRTAANASDAMLQLRNYDDLTGLPNRALFTDFLGLALARAERLGGQAGVIFLDLDGFKEINETLGRQIGDELLRHLGDRLRRCLRHGDQVARDESAETPAAVARLSGDEFVILIHDVESRQAVQTVADRLLAAVSRPFTVSQRKLHLSAGIGVALAPEDGTDEETLIQRAETAMYHAKRKGTGSWVFFHPAMKSAAIHKLETKLGLRRALEENGFELHYQPLLNTDGVVTSLEALIRWRHPERGLVWPDDFIPVAEDTELMVPIGDWVLHEVCRQLTRWQAAGAPRIPVSMNISLSQLEQPDFVASVAAALTEHDTDPRCLSFELSERGVLRNDPALLERLTQLRAAGIALAIDDFGIGQTSLAYLRRFPLDVLKIDRSFVAGLTRDPDADAITSAILAMARKLDLGVVAEGVETEEQAEFLRHHDCDALQGFLFHRPLPPAELEDSLGWPSQGRLLASA